MSSFTSRLAEWEYFSALNHVCEELVEKSRESRIIFLQIRTMELVHSFEDVEAVMHETHMEENWARAAVFIMWLRRHDLAQSYWPRLVPNHSEWWARIVCELAGL